MQHRPPVLCDGAPQASARLPDFLFVIGYSSLNFLISYWLFLINIPDLLPHPQLLLLKKGLLSDKSITSDKNE